MKTKRILSAVLAFAMIVSTMVFPVFAEGVTDEEVLAAALASGGTVVLDSDIALTEMITVPQGVTATLDLNGHRIDVGYQADSTSKHIYAIDNLGTLTIMDSEGTGSINARGIYNGCNSKDYVTTAVMNIEGGEINAIDVDGGYAVGNYATLNMSGGTLTAYEDDPSDEAAPGNYDATALNNSGTATLTGGTIYSTTNFTYAIDSKGTLIVPEKSTVSVTGGHGAVAASGGTVSIADGEFICIGGGEVASDHVIYLSGNANLEITDGTFTHTNTAKGSSGSAVYATDSTGNVEITGGDFVGLNGMVSGNANTTISGGSFGTIFGADHYDDISDYVTDEEAVSIVKYEAIADGKLYTSLADAIAEGGEVKVLRNVTISETIVVDKETVLDLNGKTVTAGVEGERAIHVEDGATFTVDGTAGNSKMAIAEGVESYGFIKIVGDNATVNLNGGTYTGDTANGAFVRPVDGTKGNTVNMTNVTANTNAYVFSVNEGNNKLNVTGGIYTTTGAGRTFYLGGVDAVFNGVTITDYANNYYDAGIQADKSSKVILEDCIIKAESAESWTNGVAADAHAAIAVSGGSEVTVKSGKYTSDLDALYIYNSAGVANIDGGTFKGGRAALKADGSYDNTAKGVINVTDGEFDGAVDATNGLADITIEGGSFTNTTVKGAAQYITISGGQFEAGAEIENYLAEGLKLDATGKVIENKVSTEAELVAAINAGGTSVLANDITTTAAIVTSGANATVDLNGYTLNVRAGDNKFNDATKLTFKNGTINIDGVVVKGNAIFCLDEYEKTLVTELTLDNVNVVGKDYSSAYGVFYIGASSILNVNGGDWKLSNDTHASGGVFKADTSTATLNISDATMDFYNVRRGVTYAATKVEDSTIKVYGDAGEVDAEMEHGFNRSPLTITNSTVTMTDMVGRGITAQNGAVVIDNASKVTMTNVQEATIQVNNGQTVTVSTDSTVKVDKAPTVADGCEIDGTVEIPDVAFIGNEGYPSLQAAIEAIGTTPGDYTILLEGEIAGSTNFKQYSGVNITIDGQDKTTYTGQINFDGAALQDGKLTIKNIAFKDERPVSHTFINAVMTNHYPSDVLITACSFEGNYNGEDTNKDVAVALKSSKRVTIKDCTGKGLHSFLQNTSGWDLTIDNVDVTDSKSGFALGTVQGVTVKNCDITASDEGYGIRIDANTYNNNAVIEDCNVEAYIPVVVRKVNTTSNITFSGENTMTASNTDGLWCAIGTTEYEPGVAAPTEATTVKVILNDAGLDKAGLVGEYVEPTDYVAKIGDTKYDTVAEAFKEAVDGDEIVIGSLYTTPINLANNALAGKTLTISAAEGVTPVFTGVATGQNTANSNITFNGIKFVYTNDGYVGIQHCGNMVYNDCQFEGQPFLYGKSEIFNDCVFNQDSPNAYNVWTYGAAYVEFNRCIFNSAGKSVLVYNEGACATDLTVTDTDFIASQPADGDYPGNGKAAIEIDTSLMPAGTEIEVDEETTDTGFSENTLSGSTLWHDKKVTSTSANGGTTSKVTVAGEVVKDALPATGKAIVADTNNNGKYDEGEALYSTLAEALEALKAEEDIVVTMLDNATLDITAWQTLAIGGENTKTITINGNNNTLTFNKLNSDWNHVATNNDAKLILNDLTLNDSGKNNGPWNRYDLNFACDVELNNVVAEKAMAFKADATLNNVEITDANDVYAIWIQPNGQTVDINGLDVTAGRGIKIDEQYVDAPGKVNLSVEDATFVTNKKSAIVVKSEAGAAIEASNCDITQVKEDPENLVWIDEDAQAYDQSLVTVEGGTKYTEGQVVKIDESGYTSLAKAIEAANDGNTITLLEDITINGKTTIDKDVTIDLDGNTLSLGEVAATFALRAATMGGLDITGNVTLTNGTIDLSGVSADRGIFYVHDEGALTLDDVDLIGTNLGASTEVFHFGYAVTYANANREYVTFNKVNVNLDGVSGYFARTMLNGGNEEEYPIVKITDSEINITNGFQLFNTVEVDVDNSKINLNNMAEHIFRRVQGTVNDTIIKAQGNETFVKNTLACDKISFTGKTIVDDNTAQGVVLDGDNDGMADGKLEISGFSYDFNPESYLADTDKYKVVVGNNRYFVVPKYTVSAVVKNAANDKEISTVVAGETFTVDIVVTGGAFTNAGWTLKFDDSVVKYVQGTDVAADGMLISEEKQGAGSTTDEFKDGEVVQTYTFQAKDDIYASKTAWFEIVNGDDADEITYVDSYMMAGYLNIVEAAKANDSVTINLKSNTPGTLGQYVVDYDGTEHRGYAVNDLSDDTFVEYIDANGKVTKLPPAYKNAGEYNYTAKVTLPGVTPYTVEAKDSDEKSIAEVVINKRSVTPTVEFNVDPDVNTVTYKPIIVGVVDGTFTGTVVVTIDDGDDKTADSVVGTFTKDDFKYDGNGNAIYTGEDPIVIKEIAAAGELKVKVVYTEGANDNYATSEGEKTVNVDKITDEGVKKQLRDAVNAEHEYNGNERNVTVGDISKVDGEWEYVISGTGITNVGKTVQAVKFTDKSGKYNEYTYYITLEVTPRPVTIAVDEDLSKTMGISDEVFGLAKKYTITHNHCNEAPLVNSGDLGTIEVVRVEEGEAYGKEYDLTINYTPNRNYAVAVIPGKLQIGVPVRKIEVVDNSYRDKDATPDYTVGAADGMDAQRLILVYTNADAAYFTCEGKVMYDVTARGYKYVDHNYTDNKHKEYTDEYKHVYAMVVDADLAYEATDAVRRHYESKVEFAGSDEAFKPIKVTYDANINQNPYVEEQLDTNDFSMVNGIYNAQNALYDEEEYQLGILKADTNGDKLVDTEDAAWVKTQVGLN